MKRAVQSFYNWHFGDFRLFVCLFKQVKKTCMNIELEPLSSALEQVDILNEFNENEVDFLKRLLTIDDVVFMKKSIHSRLQELVSITDYAGEYSRMPVFFLFIIIFSLLESLINDFLRFQQQYSLN